MYLITMTDKYLIIGLVLFLGFVLGQELHKLKLPKIIGYLLAGIALNPQICPLIPERILEETDIIENIAIAFIAFSIGGSLVFPKLKKLGKGILLITLFEAEVTFLAITVGFLITLPFVTKFPAATWLSTFVPFSLLLGCLGSPTDPTATLAVNHEYKANGEVASTMLSVAALDDILGIINFSVAIVIAKVLVTQQSFSAFAAFVTPLLVIVGSFLLGIALGLIFNFITTRIFKETEGMFFVVILSFITLCWGLSDVLHVEPILSIMVMGAVIANFNRKPQKIFYMLERYSEELIFLIFFTLSGMHLSFKMPPVVFLLIIFFVIFRMIGKWAGTAIGAGLAGASPNVKKYTASGLVPFGGIVIGLALMMQQDPAFSKIASYLVTIVVGATIINEIIGPIFVKRALRKSGEIK